MSIKVKTKYGNMWMNINPKFKEEHSRMEFERGFLDYLENEDYDIFVDVGAAWGYFSIPASHYCELVFANEPQQARRESLVKNVTQLGIKNVHISSLAVGTGKLDLYINEGSRGMVGPKGRGRVEKADIDWISLYRILKHYLHTDAKIVIKIDVEGYELDVVESLLSHCEEPPNVVFLIERHEFPNGTGYSEETLYEFMHQYVGKKIGSRGPTSHYIFRLGDSK